ncbi:MAG: ABC transporter permease, partial [Anaerolineae bacterium]|nr:ABC transporter permease [Anaerolineae bacterium]
MSGEPTLARVSIGRRVMNALALPVLSLFSALLLSAVFILGSDVVVLTAFSQFFSDPGRAVFTAGKALADAYGALFIGVFGDPAKVSKEVSEFFATGDTQGLAVAFYPFSENFVTATPYIFAGLAVALGFRCGLFNIGAEGQIYIGAAAAAFVGYSLEGLPWIIHAPLTFLAGALAGAVWAGIAGFLKATRGAHEVINTMMLNYCLLYTS